MLKNKKSFIVLFIAVFVILVCLGIWIGIEITGSRSAGTSAPSGYTAVYMTSGDVYFGKLHWFPKPYLADALYITKTPGQDGQMQFGLAAFKSVIWGPTGDIYFNPLQVLLTAPLRNDSPIVQEIENPVSMNGALTSPSEVAPAPSEIPGTGAMETATSTPSFATSTENAPIGTPKK